MGGLGALHLEPWHFSTLLLLAALMGLLLAHRALRARYVDERSHEARFRSLAAATSQFVWSTDAQGRLQRDYPEWRALTGQTVEEMLAPWGWAQAVHQEDRPRVIKRFSSAIEKGELYEAEYRLTNKGGTVAWVQARGVPVFGHDKIVREYVGTIADITVQRRLEHEREFLESVNELLFSKLGYDETASGVLGAAVPALGDCAMLELAADGGSSMPRHFRDRDLAKEELASEKLKGLEPSSHLDGEPKFEVAGSSSCAPSRRALFRELGLQCWIEAPLVARNYRLGVLTLGFRDRTPDEAEHSLVQAFARRAALALDNARHYREAQSAIRARDDFLSAASHELKSPLTPLLLNIQALRKVGGATKAIDRIQRQLQRMAKLIDQLLDVSRIVGGGLSLEPERVDLAQVAQTVLEHFEDPSFPGRYPCELKVDLAPGVIGHWDLLRVEQIVTNLLSNAFKYGAGRPVMLTVRRSAPFAEIVVQDGGIGIAPEDQERIFGRFETAVSRRSFGGLGLGLFIVRQIVEASGGKILLESAPQKGSIFTVLLPLEPNA